jgi:hypothetical protein
LLFSLQAPLDIFKYPDLDTTNSRLLINYGIELYMQLMPARLEYPRRLQRSLKAHVIKLDAAFKVFKAGITTAMAGDGTILASWVGTSSTWDLAGPLAALGMRSAHLGKVSSGDLQSTNSVKRPTVSAPLLLGRPVAAYAVQQMNCSTAPSSACSNTCDPL